MLTNRKTLRIGIIALFRFQPNIKPEIFQKAGNDKYLLHQNIVESEDEEGNKTYTYDEKIISCDEYFILNSLQNIEFKREAEIIDEYTEKLISEGSL